MADPDKDIKPYADNVWLLKRVGLTMLAFYASLPFAPVLEALGVPHKVAAAYVIAMILLVCAVTTRWFVLDRRREMRRRAAIEALRRGEPIEHPAPVAKRSTRRRTSSYAMTGGLVMLSLGVPLIVIGASARTVAVTDLGLALIVLDLLVVAVVLPGWSARRRHDSEQRTGGSPRPS